MEWVASTLHTTSEHGVSSITTTDAHTSAASELTPPADLNGLILFAERQNLVSAHVPSQFNWPLIFVQSLCGYKLPGLRDCDKCPTYVECGNLLSCKKSQVLTLLNHRKQSIIVLFSVPYHTGLSGRQRGS